jgi:hypothetical protein
MAGFSSLRRARALASPGGTHENPKCGASRRINTTGGLRPPYGNYGNRAAMPAPGAPKVSYFSVLSVVEPLLPASKAVLWLQ